MKCYINSILFLSLIAQFSFAQQSSSKLALDPGVKIGVLPNGLTYYIRKNSYPKNRAELYLVTKAGSLHEEDNQQGLAHFTEHMAFNGTRDFPKNSLINYLQGLGVRFGADLNAYTNFDQTVFQLPIPINEPGLLENGLDILVNWAGMVLMEANEIDAERGVILEEERSRGKDMQDRMARQIYPVLLAGTRFNNRLPIGKTEVIKNFQHKYLRDFYETWYRPNLQAIIAVGDFDVEAVERIIVQKFSILKNPPHPKKRRRYSIAGNVTPLSKVVTDRECPYTLFTLYIKHPHRVTRTLADFRRALICSMVNQMLAMRFQEIQQMTNAPFVMGSAYFGELIGNNDAFTMSIRPNEPASLKSAIAAGYTEILRMKKYGFTQEEFDLTRKNLLSSIERSYNDRDKLPSVSYVEKYRMHFMHGETALGVEQEYKLYNDILPQLSLREVNEIAASFITPHNQIMVVEANEEDKLFLPASAQLPELLKVNDKMIKPYKAEAVGDRLLQVPPTTGKVVSEKKIVEWDATELTLSNGMKVVLKPTDFKDDEILISAYSKGGYSLADSSCFRAAQFAAAIVSSSGVSAYSPVQIKKILGGKMVSVSPYIGTYEEGLQAGSTTKDVETVFQLLHLYFTAPRKDTHTVNSLKRQFLVGINNRTADPKTAFVDTLFDLMNSHNFRTKPLTAFEVEGLDMNSALSFYQERFSDADDFTVAVVGKIEYDQIVPLVCTYLGSLPSLPESDRILDVGLRPLSGQVSRKVFRGIEDKAEVSLNYHGSYPFSEKENILLDGLKMILLTKLTARLREKEGGVYTPSVSVTREKRPVSLYNFQITFNCAPGNADRLIAAVNDEIGLLKTGGITTEDVHKFKMTEKGQFELRQRENGFWLAFIKSVYKGELSKNYVENYSKELDEVDTKDLQRAAQMYLNDDNLISVQLLPEKER